MVQIGMENGPHTILYKYLINQAKNNSSYQPTTNNSSFDTSRAVVTTSATNYFIGPFKYNKNNSDAVLNANTTKITDQNGSDISSSVKLVKTASDTGEELNGSNLVNKIDNGAGADFYISLPKTTSATSVKIAVAGTYKAKTANFYQAGTSEQPLVVIDDGNKSFSATTTKNLPREEEPKHFDLALRKYITSINGVAPTVSRKPSITKENLRQLATRETTLDSGKTTLKNHTKDPLQVNTNDTVIYRIEVYNEGEIDGNATEITDYLPAGLQIVPISDSTINAKYGWKMYDATGAETTDNTKAVAVTSTYLASDAHKLTKFNPIPENGNYTISSDYVEIECKVVATTTTTDTHLKNVAEITKYNGGEGITDWDSTAGNLSSSQRTRYEPGTSTIGKGYEDDDDYENLILPGRYFDLSLRKYITSVNDKNYDRAPVYDVSPLLTGKTTADYKHKKDPVSVSAGDIVTYTISVFNEGLVDGYVQEITDHLPEELEFINNDFNAEFGWVLDPTDSTQRTVKTTKLSKENDADNYIGAFDQTGTSLNHKEVKIQCKVKSTAQTLKEITNIAEITKYYNDAGLADRDNESNATIPSDDNLPSYKGNSENIDDLSNKNYYYKGQEDDDDFEKVILRKFDLALRKFITGVNDEVITTRVPQVDTSKYGTVEDGKEITTFTYTHTKEPVRVEQNDIVTYTIRVYNEGTQNGYAEEIKDDIPEGLEFLPDNSTNEKYRWEMIDADGNTTEDVSKAVSIKTSYLGHKTSGTTSEVKSHLLKAFDSKTMANNPDYLDVQVAFRVIEPNTSDRIIINQAQISKDLDENGDEVTDIDSTPDEWIEGEDDQDIEKLYVKYFDLALRKWVTTAIVIEDGVQKEMETDHYAEQEPEPAVKVELNKKRIENTVIKFKYNIRITNEGEIEGYATEISDYIPAGLKFNQADNPNWKEVNGKIVTEELKDKLLKPGESAIIELVLTWINDEANMGVMTNWAEISKDKNASNTPDIDSTPNNKIETEDDMDYAPVVLAVIAGIAQTYIIMTAVGFIIVAGGVFGIKKYVL